MRRIKQQNQQQAKPAPAKALPVKASPKLSAHELYLNYSITSRKKQQSQQQAKPAPAKALPVKASPKLSGHELYLKYCEMNKIPIKQANPIDVALQRLHEEDIVLIRKLFDYLKGLIGTGIDFNSSISEEGLNFLPKLKTALTPTSTYLHAAVLAREPKLVAFLLEHGAEVNKLDAANHSPWDIGMMIFKALWLSKVVTSPNKTQLIEIFKILLQHGASLSREQSLFFNENLSKEIDKESCQRTQLARIHIKKFLESGKHIDELNNKGQSLLHTAVTEEALEKVILLLENGADPNLQNANKESAIQIMLGKIEHKINTRPSFDRRTEPGWDGWYEMGNFREDLSITLGNIDKKWKEICIWLLRYAAALDKAHHSNFMLMGIDLIAIREEQMIYSTKLAKRAELLNKKSAEDRIKLREQVDELQGYVKEDIHMLKETILNMVGMIEGLQQEVLLLREDNQLLREDNQLLREDNQRLIEGLNVINERRLPEPQRINRLTYEQSRSLTFFTKEEVQEQVPTHSLSYTEGLN